MGVAARMAELPSGTVTFLFSDVEGSTRLLTRLRGRYAEVLAEHQRLLRAAFDEHDGREVHTEGDAFFVAFARASDAIAAAVSAQRSLASQRWPEGVDVRVRMGVHTGEAEVRQDDYVGLDVHRAARICAAGHGGQVLISSSTRELVADELPADVALRDLGEHRLKDLDRPEQLFQLVVGDLPADFPPLASLSPGSGGANGLPPPPNRTIGRERRRARDRASGCAPAAVRLLTLTGPGRGGQDAARRWRPRARSQADFADGAHFVSLAALQRPEDVPAAIVKALGIVVLSGESADQAAERFLAAKHLLLVARQLRARCSAAAPFVGRLLEACPALTVLATSREPLGLHAEERYPVAPLALPARATPEDADALAGVDAVALFCERARAHDPDFDLGRRQRRRGRGDLPARRRAAAGDRAGGRPLRAAVAGRDRRTPRRRARRAGRRRPRRARAPADAARDHRLEPRPAQRRREAVLRALRGVRRRRDGRGGRDDHRTPASTRSTAWSPRACSSRRQHAHAPTRLGMLETIRAYAGERFAAAADAEAVRERHYRYYLALAQRHGTERALRGAGAQRAPRPARRRDRQPPRGPRLGGRAGRAPSRRSRWRRRSAAYWLMRDRYADAVDWIDQALSLPGADAHPALRVRALLHEGQVPVAAGARSRATRGPGRRRRPIARALGDPVILSQALQMPRRITRSMPSGSMSRTRSPTRRSTGPAAAGDDWEIAEASRAKAIAASEHRRAARARRHGRLAAQRRRQRPSAREPAHRRGLRRALPRQRS